MVRIETFYLIICCIFILVTPALFSCHAKSGVPEDRSRHHLFEVNSSDGERLYVDSIPSRAIMQMRDTGDFRFKVFLIGFEAPLNAPVVPYSAKGKYVQFGVEHDWVGIVQGDSISPSFYHPKEKVQQFRDEGYLVFELPAGQQLEALVYQDSFGQWKTQHFILTSTNNHN